MSKIITISGSSRFVELMAVVAWMMEKEGNAVFSLNYLPNWYDTGPDSRDHLAEKEKCSDILDKVHFKKISVSDELFVLDWNFYVGESTKQEIDFALSLNKPVFYYMSSKYRPMLQDCLEKSLSWLGLKFNDSDMVE